MSGVFLLSASGSGDALTIATGFLFFCVPVVRNPLDPNSNAAVEKNKLTLRKAFQYSTGYSRKHALS